MNSELRSMMDNANVDSIEKCHLCLSEKQNVILALENDGSPVIAIREEVTRLRNIVRIHDHVCVCG